LDIAFFRFGFWLAFFLFRFNSVFFERDGIGSSLIILTQHNIENQEIQGFGENRVPGNGPGLKAGGDGKCMAKTSHSFAFDPLRPFVSFLLPKFRFTTWKIVILL